jgi:Amt family ammonium transporter
MIGGIFYDFASKIVVKCKVDDPLDAFAVHYGGGIWGVLSVGFFDMTNGLFYGAGFK